MRFPRNRVPCVWCYSGVMNTLVEVTRHVLLKFEWFLWVVGRKADGDMAFFILDDEIIVYPSHQILLSWSCVVALNRKSF